MSKKVLSADNQQERPITVLNPWYIVGFVEGEGTFHIAFYNDPNMKQKIKVIPEFHVNQSYLRISTLQEIQKYFDCGYIKVNHAKRANDDTYVYVVRDREDLLKKIIPFFRQYPLRSIKRESYEKFARIVVMTNLGKHREKNGMKKIINLAYQMNVGGKYRIKKKEELLSQLESSETIR
jgi:hypothetical protein